MMTLRSRLVASYLIVLSVGILVAAPLTWLAIERLYLETQRANLLAQAEVAAAALREAPAPPAEPYSQATNILPGIHTHILDLPASAGGAVAVGYPPELAQRDGVTLDELLARPEIAGALAGHSSTAIRLVEVADGRWVLYAAAPVIDEQGSVTRLVYIASPLPLASWDSFSGDIRLQLLGALIGAFLIAAAAGWWIAARISRPLDALAIAARQVAAGERTHTVEPDRNVTELAALGQAFNQMTGDLRRADELKAGFIADVSHELRTPLTVIKGVVETLQDGAVDDLTVRDSFLNSMAAETDRLISLVNDLLTLTRAEAGALSLEPQPVSLLELAESRVTWFMPLAERRGVRLGVTYGSNTIESPCVSADPQRITQVLDNLLSNALRHTPHGGHVTVTVEPAGNQLRCAVVDTGCGIHEQYLPHVFDRFYRADASRSRVQGGSGLGLAICRALVVAHHGRIQIESAVGQGTSVTFWLPIADCR